MGLLVARPERSRPPSLLFAKRYLLGDLLGCDESASVFHASDERLGRRVLLKILHEACSTDPGEVERFRREASVTARLSHPNIITVLDRGECDGRHYIVFEHIDGESLEQLVARRSPLPVERALELAVEIGQGLTFAHSRGIAHGAVAARNVLAGRESVKLTGFGAISAADANDDAALAEAWGARTGERRDIRSLGAVLFDLLAGDAPVRGDGSSDGAPPTDEPPRLLARLADAPSRVAAAVTRALDDNPAARFHSMRELVTELRECLDELTWVDEPTAIIAPRSALPSAGRGRLVRQHTRRRTLAAAVVLLSAGLAGVAYLVGMRGHAPSRAAGPTAVASPVVPGTAHTGNAHGVSEPLRAVATYDPPPGDGVEDNSRLALATDSDPATYWSTEWYATPQFGGLKHGVGIVLATGQPVRLTTLVVRTDTPGWNAIIKAGSSPAGPFAPVSTAQTLAGTTTIALHTETPARYFLIWITKLSPVTGPRYQAHINTATAR